MEAYSVVGKRLPRVDGGIKATGEAKFTDDMALPRMLCGKILRSPYPHARIVNIDTTKAERLPGVKGIITGKDTAGIKYLPIEIPHLIPDELGLAIDKVRYIGEEVAAAAAIDEDTAEEALDLIRVEYEELPAVFDPEEALKPDAPKIHDHAQDNISARIYFDFGDVDRGFKESDHIREDQFFIQFQNHCFLEPHASLASFDPSSGKVTIWISTQSPFQVRRDLAKTLDMPTSLVRVIKPHIGGGFGGKVQMRHSHFCSALLSIKSARPVKIIETREEVLISGFRRHSVDINVKTGVKRDGILIVNESQYIIDGGAYTGIGPIVPFLVGIFRNAPYRVPNIRLDGRRVYTNKPLCGPMRGYGVISGFFAFESHLDMIIEDLGLDPLEFRLKNARQAGDITPSKWIIKSCEFTQCLQKVAEKSGFREKRDKLPKNQGIGLTGNACVNGVNVMPSAAGSANVQLHDDGGVTILVGASEIGQGMDTILCQVAAEELGVALKDIRLTAADTEITPLDHGSYSMRGTMFAGNAVKAAAANAKRQLLEVAAQRLEANIEDLEAKDRRIYVKGSPEKGISIPEAISTAQASKRGEPITGKGSYNPPDVGPPSLVTGEGNISPSYSFGANAAQVDVDPETGQVKVTEVTAAHETGVALNPLAVEGQIDGAIGLAMGQTFMEEFNFDKGQTLETSFLDYKIPTALDVPKPDMILVESNDPEGPFGAKQASEGANMSMAPTIANAIYNAIGVRIKKLPLTPEKILEALEQKV